MLKYRYSPLRPPGATTALVLVGASPAGGSATITATMQIDTGCEHSLIPRRDLKQLFKQLGVSNLPHDSVLIEGLEGKGFRRAHRYLLKTQKGHFGNGRELPFVETTEPIGFLGRDVLNEHLLVLHGPRQRWGFK